MSIHAMSDDEFEEFEDSSVTEYEREQLIASGDISPPEWLSRLCNSEDPEDDPVDDSEVEEWDDEFNIPMASRQEFLLQLCNPDDPENEDNYDDTCDLDNLCDEPEFEDDFEASDDL